MSPTEIEYASMHLEQYWAKLGFEKWSKAGTYPVLMGLWTGRVLPRIEEIVPHLFEHDA